MANIRLFDPSVFARTSRDPIFLLGFVIDLLPIAAILWFGWGVNELVIFYWMENLIIGAGVWLRLLLLGTVGAKPSAWFLLFFFPVHYGIFCAVHGIFLIEFFPPDFTALPLFIGASLLWELIVFVRYYWMNGQYERDDPGVVMFSPYGRVVIVHLAIFVAAFSSTAMGSAVLGAVFILIVDIGWGIAMGLWRKRRELERETLGTPAIKS